MSATSLPPTIDNRTFDDIMGQIRDLARSYLNNRWTYAAGISKSKNHELVAAKQNVFDWNLNEVQDDVGVVLSKIFVSFYMNIITRLNKLPAKNFIEFLNLVGFNLASPTASRVPVTFKLADGAKDDVFVSAGTIVSADANDKHDELIFGTEENMKIIRANLSQIYTVNKAADIIQSHSENIRNKEDFIMFSNHKENLQQHILYLGHQDLFNLKNTSAKIFVTMISEETENLENLLVDSNNTVWEYNWKYDNEGKEVRNSAHKFTIGLETDANDENTSLIGDQRKRRTIVLYNRNNPEKKIEKSKVNGIENHWIRCRFQPLEDRWNFTDIVTNRIPTIAEITVKVELDTESSFGSDISSDGFVDPDMLFYKDAPILIPTEDPKQADIGAKGIGPENQYDEDDAAASRSRDPLGSGKLDTLGGQKFIYPFGKLPFTFDTFFIASNDCFSKKNTIVTLKFLGIGPDFMGKERTSTTEQRPQDEANSRSSAEEPSEKSDEPIVSWEYWNGKGWNGLSILTRGLEEKYEELNFLCPNDIERFSVSGNDNYWIRARLVSGDYGKPRLIQKSIASQEATAESPDELTTGIFEWDYTGTIKTPKFKQLKIKFTDVESFKVKSNESTLSTGNMKSQTLKHASRPLCIIHNNLQYDVITNSDNSIAKPSRVFKQFVDDVGNFANQYTVKSSLPAPPPSSPSHYVYLGFDKKIESGPILIYFSIIETRGRDYDVVEEQLNFYYYSPTGWTKLNVEDGTNYLTKKGYLKLFLPSDFQTHFLFGDNLYWIKVEDSTNFYSREPTQVPKVHRIILNTVSCINAFAIDDELLTRDESALNDLKFVFSRRPITLVGNKGEQIWVKENMIPSDNEWDFLLQNNRIKVTKDAGGNLLETWVLWSEFGYQNHITNRTQFLSESPQYTSRIYSIDRIEGYLNLDPIRGEIGESPLDNIGVSALAKQINTVVKASYIVGGGSQGNVAAEEVRTLKSLIPFVESVINFEKGGGGSDALNVQNAKEFLPSLIGNRGQAVTIADFESLIINRFSSLLKVKCFPTTDSRGNFQPGHVLVVVIPKKGNIGNSRGSSDNDGKNDQVSSLISSEHSGREEMPYPSVDLLKDVMRYARNTASDTIISPERLHITGPAYFRIFISANIYVAAIDDLHGAERKAVDLIRRFLDPLEGGKDGRGWEFRKIPSISELYRLLSGIPEAKHIDKISARLELGEIILDNFKERNKADLKKKFILSETDGDDLDVIMSTLLPHSLLCDGYAHSLTMGLSS